MELVCGTLAADPPTAVLDDLAAIGDRTGATVQAFDARYVVSTRHLERALELADRAIDRGEAIADDRSVEVLLYAAGRRQINRAFGIGLKDGDHPVVVLCEGGEEAAAVRAVRDRFAEVDPCDGRHADEARLVRYFDVTEAERDTGAALEDLVLERVALLAVTR